MLKVKCTNCGINLSGCPVCGSELRIPTSMDSCPCYVVRRNLDLLNEGKLPSGSTLYVQSTADSGTKGECYTCVNCGKQHVMPASTVPEEKKK